MYEVTADSLGNVWVNRESGLVARFSKRGIDIHSLGLDNHCLDCRSKFTDLADWKYFVSKVQEIYGVDVLAHLPSDFNQVTLFVKQHQNNNTHASTTTQQRRL